MINEVVKYSWVETHKELVQYLARNQYNQIELIDLLKKVGITGFNDKDSTGEIELDEIDPFTFFCYINKYGSKKRLSFLQQIAKELDIKSVPTDDSGIPSAQGLKVWLFPYKFDRNSDEISRLWKLFFSILDDNISDDQFEDVLEIRSTAKTKLTEALFTIDPQRYFPINGPSKPYMKEVLGIDPKFETYTGYLNILGKIKEKSNKPFYEISFEAWEWNNQKTNSISTNASEPTTSKKYWLYAPGRNAFLWDEFYDQGIMGLGWDKLGDLNNYSTKEEISLKLQELTDSSSDPKNNSTANYEFKNVISEGDIIIAKRGRGELVGYGIVKSEYYYDENRSTYQKCRKVEWRKKGSWKTDFSLALKTLTDVTRYATDHPEYEFYYERLMGIMDDKKEYQLKFPLNTIFYGPPGTGKTYNTVLKAAQIIENKIIDNFKEAQEIFNQNLGDRIEFITFHQNYSYEDFIQGIRPDVESGNNLSFEKKDGVFTRIAVNALFEYFKEYKKISKSSNKDKKLDVNEIYLDFIENLKSRENKEYETISGSKVFIHTINKNDNIEFKHHNSSRTYLVSSVRLLKLFHVYPDIKDIKNLNNDIRDVIGGCNATVYWVALKEFINFYNNYQTVSTEDVKDEYEEVGYETKKKLISTVDLHDLRKVQSTSVKKYVIIIDEINRANISRVFGELITLIEPDKRSHGHIPLTCTLPSSDSFIIPSNLYIIGTMNTADKSIALLDIALRRRFEFESMYPLYEIVGLEIFDVDILQKINEKIIKKKGHDFQIGHSYFMGDNIDLTDRMNNKVIPLLLEYFMNDEKEVKEILSSAGLTIKQGTWPLEIVG